MIDLLPLEKIIEVEFKDKGILYQALIHRSYLNESKEVAQSNERLEFLGDSVLSLLVSTELYQRFPDYSEGILTNLRSGLVRTTTLAKIAAELGFGNYIQMSRGEEHGGGRSNTSLLANTFEAILGAIYLDQGFTVAQSYIKKHLFPLISDVGSLKDTLDYKSRLQEEVQENQRVSPVYKVLTSDGPDHDKTFEVGVYVNDKLLAKGKGKSKQEAEQLAAKEALGSSPLEETK